MEGEVRRVEEKVSEGGKDGGRWKEGRWRRA